MWTLILVYICLAEATEESNISLGDRMFSGPDERLVQVLERRRALSGDAHAAIRQLEQYMSTPRPVARAIVDVSLRRQEFDVYNKLFELPGKVNDTESTAPMFMVTKLIKILMDNVQQRVHEVQPLLSKYASDPRYRYGSVVCGLGAWQRQMVGTMTRVVVEGARLPLRHHVLNYQLLLAKNIDIDHVRQYLRFNESNPVDVTLNTNKCTRCLSQPLKYW